MAALAVDIEAVSEDEDDGLTDAERAAMGATTVEHDQSGVAKLVGEWTIRWENGNTFEVSVLPDGQFEVYGNWYQLNSTWPPTFSWQNYGDGETFQWCKKFQLHHITWTTNNPTYPRIWWERKIPEEQLAASAALAIEYERCSSGSDSYFR